MNKRDFVLGGCSTLIASAGLSSSAHADQLGVGPVRRLLKRLPDLERHAGADGWRQYVGERFTQLRPGSKAEFVLRRVTKSRVDMQGEQFTLLFAASVAVSIPVAAQSLLHGATGQQIPIFLQPAGDDLDGLKLYRADFNRLA